MNNNADKRSLNIYCILRDVYHDWKTILVVAIAAALLSYVVTGLTYQPTYTSKATMVVSVKGSTTGPYGSVSEVSKLTDVFQAVVNSAVLKRLVCEELEIKSFDGTIGMSVVPETNLLTMSVTSPRPDTALKLLKAFHLLLLQL